MAIYPIFKYFYIVLINHVKTYLWDILGFVPDHCNKANIALKKVIQIFWFPSAYKSNVYTTAVY